MGKVFDLDDETKSIISDALDDFITELGKPCLLVYPPTRWESCVNCVYDPIGKKSSNRFRHGGPLPFPNGSTCPQCGGQGMRPVESTEEVQFSCEWQPKQFVFPIAALDLRVPHSFLQTKGFIKDWPKVEQCDHMVYQTSLAGMGSRRFKLVGEPGDRSNIIQGRYFFALWQRQA